MLETSLKKFLIKLKKDYDDIEDIFENVLDEGVDILEIVADELGKLARGFR